MSTHLQLFPYMMVVLSESIGLRSLFFPPLSIGIIGMALPPRSCMTLVILHTSSLSKVYSQNKHHKFAVKVLWDNGCERAQCKYLLFLYDPDQFLFLSMKYNSFVLVTYRCSHSGMVPKRREIRSCHTEQNRCLSAWHCVRQWHHHKWKESVFCYISFSKWSEVSGGSWVYMVMVGIVDDILGVMFCFFSSVRNLSSQWLEMKRL